jgi:hypothetical protein
MDHDVNSPTSCPREVDCCPYPSVVYRLALLLQQGSVRLRDRTVPSWFPSLFRVSPIDRMSQDAPSSQPPPSPVAAAEPAPPAVPSAPESSFSTGSSGSKWRLPDGIEEHIESGTTSVRTLYARTETSMDAFNWLCDAIPHITRFCFAWFAFAFGARPDQDGGGRRGRGSRRDGAVPVRRRVPVGVRGGRNRDRARFDLRKGRGRPSSESSPSSASDLVHVNQLHPPPTPDGCWVNRCWRSRALSGQNPNHLNHTQRE